MKYILGSDSITVYHKGVPYSINKQAPTFGMVLDAVKNNDEAALEAAVNIRKSITDKLSTTSANVRIDGNKIMHGTREITGLISTRIFEVIRLGLSVEPMIKFLENLMANPSKRAVDELFGFMEACNLPITEDGHFLAYKRVRGDYFDVHSRTLDNSVGNTLEMPRNLVDEDKNNTCSYGLHFCSYDYLKHFSGERIVVLKINPADVVAIPADYNNSKGRTCKYEVVDELPLNEYKLPERELDEGYTTKYSPVDTPEVEIDALANLLDELDDDLWESSSEWMASYDEEDDIVVNPSAKLTPAEVRDIRMDYACDVTIAKLAVNYGVSARTIGRIVNRESWKNV